MKNINENTYENTFSFIECSRVESEAKVASFRDHAVNAGISYTVCWRAEDGIIGQAELRWIDCFNKRVEQAIETGVDPIDLIEELVEEMTERLLDWTPMRSTCPFTNASADCDHKALKNMRSLFNQAVKSMKAER